MINLDALTYAGSLENLISLKDNPFYHLIHVENDINNSALLADLFNTYTPRAVLHFAAESHVDNSIASPIEFIRTNINGTFTLLESAKTYWNTRTGAEKDTFRFLHISTDEVYGSLLPNDPPFAETNQYQPNSPYSASKAASDHLVRAWYHTYGLPVLTTNCSNNYGPHQFPEKLIPVTITNALRGGKIPIYGNGENIRDWLYVKDHCDAIRCVLNKGVTGEPYNVGGGNEIRNIDLVTTVCHILDQLKPKASGSYADQITFVADRQGHDKRYAIDSTKIKKMLGWQPNHDFYNGIRSTVEWYLHNQDWTYKISNDNFKKIKEKLIV